MGLDFKDWRLRIGMGVQDFGGAGGGGGREGDPNGTVRPGWKLLLAMHLERVFQIPSWTSEIYFFVFWKLKFVYWMQTSLISNCFSMFLSSRDHRKMQRHCICLCFGSTLEPRNQARIHENHNENY